MPAATIDIPLLGDCVSPAVLRNHGLLPCGRTAGEAFEGMSILEAACRIQILAQAGGGPLVKVPKEILDDMGRQAREVSQGKGADLVWPGLLRRLERRNPGHDA